MKQWFPFTDYDFYGYLASGALLVFALDYWHAGSSLLLGDSLTFMQGVLAVSLAYIAGQIIAIPSSTLLEGFFAKQALRQPLLVLLGQSTPFERFLSDYLIGHYYSPLADNTKRRVFERALSEENLDEQGIIAAPESLFQPAYRVARRNEDARTRMDDFRNQYGFARNIAMSSLVASLLMFHRAAHDDTAMTFAWLALVLFIGMLIRFLKFYTCFTREVIQAYAHER